MGLAEHAAAAGRRVGGVLEPALPAVRGRAAAREGGEEDRPAGVDGEVAQAVLVVVGVVGVLAHGRLAADLDRAAVDLAELHDQLADLVPVGEAAGHGVAVGGLVGG